MKSNRFAWAGAAVAATAMVLAGCAGAPPAGTVESFESASALAAERGTPLLLDFYTDW